MLGKTITRKLHKNKRNNQFSLTLPKKILCELKEGKETKIRNPKKVKIKIEEFLK
jgi:hypothetical protein